MADAAPVDVRDYMEDQPFVAAAPALSRASRPSATAAAAAAGAPRPSINLDYHMAKLSLSAQHTSTPSTSGGAAVMPPPKKSATHKGSKVRAGGGATERTLRPPLLLYETTHCLVSQKRALSPKI